MKSFAKYIDAEKYAKEVSARDLKSISIVHLFPSKKEFTVMDTKNEWFYGIEYVMSIKNYDTPFEVHSVSPKSGLHIEAYPTKEMANTRAVELRKEGYRRDVFQKDLTSEQHFKNWVETSLRCQSVIDEYRQELLSV
jgi:hypothetical protein